MRLAFALSLLLCSVVALLATDPPKEKDKPKDSEAIIGRWDVVRVDFGDKPIDTPDKEIGKAYFAFLTVGKMGMKGFDDKSEVEGEYKIDPATNPKAIDLILKGGKEKRLGLYELDGDTLRLCVYSSTFDTRPKEIKADGKTYLGVITLKRSKPEKKDK